MAGMRVVVVGARDDGTVDLDDLRGEVRGARDATGGDHGHLPLDPRRLRGGHRAHVRAGARYGGQVYIDGANLNALLGLAKPGQFGGDVSHLNLHKTFCIPHGGGGPGRRAGRRWPSTWCRSCRPTRCTRRRRSVEGIGPVSAAPYGSAGILAISWAYIRLLSGAGLAHATKSAVLAANYVATRLSLLRSRSSIPARMVWWRTSASSTSVR